MYMRMCKYSLALICPHVDVHAALCLQLQTKCTRMFTLFWSMRTLCVQHLIVSESRCMLFLNFLLNNNDYDKLMCHILSFIQYMKK